MLLEIVHSIRYLYHRPVRLCPHTLRVQPRGDGSQRLIRFDLQISPKPRGLSSCLDPEGNITLEAWWEGWTPSFRVISAFEVETLRANPFDYLVDPAALRLPLCYPEPLRARLLPWLSSPDPGDEVARFAGEIRDEVGGETLRFLPALCRRIRESCQGETRLSGEPQPAAISLRERRGSCRDLAVLFQEACRRVGIAARFVTGYQQAIPPGGRRELHAWAEAFIPGGGWRGFDPSIGLAVSDHHVVLAAAAASPWAAPITGSYRGEAVETSFSTEIQIRALRASSL